MPETHDFDQIAREIISNIQTPGYDDANVDETEAAIITQLRLVWNARGAADLTAIRADLVTMLTGPPDYTAHLDETIQKLDR